MKTVSKTFATALEWFYKDIRKFKRFLDDKRINAAERAILQSWLFLRDNQFKEAQSEIAKISQTSDNFVSGQKRLIEGIIFFNQGELLLALPHLQKAHILLVDSPCDDQKNDSSKQLVQFALELKTIPKEMKNLITKMEDLECSSTEARIRRLRCQFNYFSFFEQFEVARSVLQQLNSLKNSMNENQRIFFVDLFDFQVKEGHFKEAKNTLGEMRNYRKFHLTQNFNYMKAMISFLTEDEKFYIYEKDFETHQFLFYQLKVIESLSLKDHNQANIFWMKLASLFPQTYSKEFNYQGDKCLFSLCLEKLKIQNSGKRDHLTFIDDGTLECRVLQELQKESILKKEDLYHLLYGEFPKDKNDLIKLAKVISRAREKYDLSIKTNKGCYELIYMAKAS